MVAIATLANPSRVRLWIFLLFQALYALTSSGNAFRVPDEFEVYYQVEHLASAGDLSIPQAAASGRFFGRVGVDRKPYAPYGPLSAVLALPHHILARGIAQLAGLPRNSMTWTFVVSGLTMLTTSTAAALVVVGFHRAAMLVGASSPVALLLSLMLGGASVLWPYGTSLYSEAWQAAFFIWAAVYLLERRIALASVLLALAGLTKFTSLVFTPGFIVAVLVDRSVPAQKRVRAAIALGAGVATALAIHLAWNRFRFGNPFEFGYDWSETIPVLPARAFLLSSLPRGLAVLLLSPGKSIFLWAPVLVLGFSRLPTCSRPLCAGVTTSALIGLIFYGAYLFPEGGYAHGPRNLVPILPLLLLPAATPGPRWRRDVVMACASVGFAIALLSVSVSFLQDQAMGNNFQSLGYYERIDPPSGRPWNRYRLDYVPFINTTASADWPVSSHTGLGLDFFPLHLMRAKGEIAEARAIPGWLPLALVLGWSALLMAALVNLWPLVRNAAADESLLDPPILSDAATPIAIPPRWVAVALVALSLAYLWLFVPRGWIPHDEGMIGQSAERVLAGETPHVDYEEPYTGGLTLMHAGVFKIAGINLLYPRWLLFLGAVLAQALTYVILRRFLGPIGAAAGACVALAWSFPNYFAALPSWWVLVCALACLWAFIRYVETGSLRFAAAAGVAAAVSILIKQTGVYLLVALVMALLYGGAHEERASPAWWPGRLLCASAGIVALAFALFILRSRPDLAELLYLLVPIAACSLLLLTTDGGRAAGIWPRLAAPVVAVAAAAVPLLLFVAPYLVHAQVGTLVNGLFVLPQKRLQFASMAMPPAGWILAAPFLVAMMLPTVVLTTALWYVAVLLPIVALYNPLSYQLIWQSARGFAALLPVAVCWLLWSGRVNDKKQRWIMFGFAAMLAWASLVQFPFAASIYFCYVTPLAVIATVAAANSTQWPRRPALGAVAVLLVLFAVLAMNRGYIYNLGYDHEAYALNVPLVSKRANLDVSASEAATYRDVMQLIRSHLGDGRLVAGPDCPEVYFLAGRFSQTGTLFDFFTGDVTGAKGVADMPEWNSASVIVLNHYRSFSQGLSPDFVARVRQQYPFGEQAGQFEVRWRR